MNIQPKTIRAVASRRAAKVIAPAQPRLTMRWQLCDGALVRVWQTAEQPALDQPRAGSQPTRLAA
jgi:hypothetical protein